MTNEEEYYLAQLFQHHEKRINLIEDYMHDISKMLYTIHDLLTSFAEEGKNNENKAPNLNNGVLHD